MPAPCTVCKSKDLSELQKLAAQGASHTELATRFSPLTESSIQRHLANHIPRDKNIKPGGRGPSKVPGAKGAKGPRFASEGRCPQCSQVVGETTEKLSAEQIIKRAERVLFFAESIVTKAQENEDARLALQGVDRCQRSIDTLARIAGLLKNEVVIDNRQINIYENWQTEPLRALEAFHKVLGDTQDLNAAIEAARATQQGNKKPPALLPGASENEGVV